MKWTYTLLPVLLVLAMTAKAQTGVTSRLLQEIGFYSDVMINANADEHRARGHEILGQAMDSLLAQPDSYSIPLDSIKWLSVLHGEGFRLVTWQWKVNQEEYKYDGFIQWPDKVTRLKDTRPFVNGSAYNTYTPNLWYGCLYYDMIPFEKEGKKYYLLLGFNGDNSQTNIKLADVLDLTGSEPKLGLPVFVGKDEARTRILLTYADVSTVHIRYDAGVGGIIYDHVENLPGVGPNGETMPVSDGSLEGWVLKDGNWLYQEEVYDVQVETPPMTDERKDRKEDKDILGRPKKE